MCYMARMERDDVLNVRVPASLKAALRAAATKERRSLSALVELILSAWLDGRGTLPKVVGGRPKPKGR